MTQHISSVTFITCDLCDTQVKSDSQLFYHRKKCHTEPKDYKFECLYCSCRFFKKSSLTSHMDQHTGVKRVACDSCSKTFRNQAQLNYHVRTVHTDSSSFLCEKCNKSFKCDEYLKAHMRLHEKNYTCPRCEDTFSYPLTLRRHMKMYHEDFVMPPPTTQLKNFDWKSYEYQ